MDITLPNGKVLRGVPDGTSKHIVAQKAIANGLATNADFGYEGAEAFQEGMGAAGETKLGRLREGIGQGMVDTARNVGNMLGLVDDEAIAEADRLDADLLNTGMGMTGSVVGQLAATAPVGGVVGVGGRAAGAGLKATRAAGNVSRANMVRAGRVLQSPVARGAVEGAAYGTIFADPNERGTGAAIGTTLGAGFGKLGQKVGEAWGNFRLTSLSDEAKATMAATGGEFIPLSQSAKPGIVKQFYNAILANLPGVGGKVRGQYDDAVQDLRHWVSTKAHPDDPYANILINAEDDIHTMFSKLDDYWQGAPAKLDNAGNVITPAKLPAYEQAVAGEVLDATKIKIPQIVRNEINKEAEKIGVPYRVPAGVQVKAIKVLNLRNAINTLKGKVENTQFTKAMKAQMDKALKSIDDELERGLSADSYAAYSGLGGPYKNYQVLGRALDKAKSAGQEFTPQQLLVAAAEKGGQGARSGGGPLQQVANSAMKALPDFPSRQGIFQTVAALGLATSAIAGVGVPALIGAGGAVGLGKLLATKAFQKFISGQHRGKELLNHPKFKLFLRTAGYSGRQQATIKANILAGEE